MAVLITSNTQKKVFNQEFITIGSSKDCDFVINIGKEKLVLQFSQEKGKYVLTNKNPKILYRGQNFNGTAVIEKSIKLTIMDTEDFIAINIVELAQEKASKQNNTNEYDYTEEDMKNIYGQNSDITTKEKIEKQKMDLESQRSPIIKQVGFAINDIKKRLTLNNSSSIFVHFALFFSSIVTAFGVSNFITGLKIQETANFINLPTNIKILALFTILVYGLSIVLKQASFLYFQNKKYPQASNNSAQTFLAMASVVFFIGIYLINLIYYINLNSVFAIIMSLFFVGLTVILAIAAGYFKSHGHNLAYELDKYEYREDFEAILNNYRLWIDKYINTLGNNKIENMKDKLFNLQLKSVGEIVLGILTAPFLAYGVSNTLAMCFPDAAGWIRISGLRFSPIFLTLATFLIIFAFFSFVNAFLATRKIHASQVIKHDGFSDYFSHGVDILGLQAVKKLDGEKNRCLAIACSIIFIEFTMNVSYFSTEIGGDLQGILLSVIAALVPTALLVAETYMLSQTKFDIESIESLLAKKD